MTLDAIFDWLRSHEVVLGWLGAASVAMFAGSLIALPLLVARIPSDAFAEREPPPSRFAASHPVLRVAMQVLRNLLGVVLLLAGIAMLVLPGQGLLTLVMALMLCDFPGKRSLERRIVAIDRVRAALDWMRRRAGREPLVAPRDL